MLDLATLELSVDRVDYVLMVILRSEFLHLDELIVHVRLKPFFELVDIEVDAVLIVRLVPVDLSTVAAVAVEDDNLAQFGPELFAVHAELRHLLNVEASAAESNVGLECLERFHTHDHHASARDFHLRVPPAKLHHHVSVFVCFELQRL
jgi:hypothetical protein